MWVCPSRGRPHNIVRLMRVPMSTPLVLMLDSDDPCLDEYERLTFPPGWRVSVGERAGLSEIYNSFYRGNPNLDWYGVFADDVVPGTPDWDKLLIEAAGNNGLAYGEDKNTPLGKATHFVVGGDLVRELGWLALPGLDRIFIDTVWNDIARERGVFNYVPVKMKHHHFSNNPLLMDRTYEKHNKDLDLIIYNQWRKKNGY